jgi:hypothetical protein
VAVLVAAVGHAAGQGLNGRRFALTRSCGVAGGAYGGGFPDDRWGRLGGEGERGGFLGVDDEAGGGGVAVEVSEVVFVEFGQGVVGQFAGVLPASARDGKWVISGGFAGWWACSVLPFPLIAARSCERVGGSRVAKRPRSGAGGALEAPTRERDTRAAREGERALAGELLVFWALPAPMWVGW